MEFVLSIEVSMLWVVVMVVLLTWEIVRVDSVFKDWYPTAGPRIRGPCYPPGKLRYPINRHSSICVFTVTLFPFSTDISPPKTGLLSLSCCR